MTRENSSPSPELEMAMQIVEEVGKSRLEQWVRMLQSHKAAEIIAYKNKVQEVLPPGIAERQLVLVYTLGAAIYGVTPCQPDGAKMALRYLQRGTLAAAMNMLLLLSQAMGEQADEEFVYVHAQPERPQ